MQVLRGLRKAVDEEGRQLIICVGGARCPTDYFLLLYRYHFYANIHRMF